MTDHTHAPDLRERLSAEKGRAFWRSLEEHSGTPEFAEMLGREFPQHASEWDEGVSRRRFLELSAASLSLAGLSACVKQPREGIVPYVKQPEEVVPGRPLFFATAATLGGYATGLLVESHTGRPTKVEGNPDHPASLGATDAYAQALVLSLYDPDRSQTITRLGQIRTWANFTDELAQRVKIHSALSGEGFRILTQTVTSPTLASQIRAVLAAMPKARWHQWEPAGRDAARAGARLAFGQAVETRHDFSKADVVLTLDADPFVSGPGALAAARAFARRRREAATSGARPPRFYAVESTPTASSALADHRFPVKPSALGAAASALHAALATGTPATAYPELAAAAADLRAAGARGLVVAGDYAPAEVHALVHAINGALGAIGTTVLVTGPVEAEPVDQLASIRDLAADLRTGKVDTLLILGGNPVFDAPADLGFADAVQKAAFRAHLSLYDDETSAYCTWQLNEAHPLEAWTDARSFDGTASIAQPLVEPLYGGKSAHEVLAAVLGQPSAKGGDLVKSTWQKQRPAGFDAFWRKALHDGLVEGTALAPLALAPKAPAASSPAAPAPAGSFELVLRPDAGLFDGRFANSGWLQELPKPLTKLVWDNVAHLSPKSAESLGLKNEDVVVVEANGKAVELPVWILPGQPDGVVTVHLGFGRTRAGRVGNGVGVDAYPLRTSAALWNTTATLRKAGRTAELASTQQHFNMEGRHLVRTGTYETYRKDPEFAKKMEEIPEISLYPGWKYEQHAWGLAVNLSSCTGCSACVVACQAENNIPTVGKDQVRRGREMHWLRIDRYHEGTPGNPAAHNQPVMCMHCEKAPCEVVCPVAATTHSDEGINEMTYNRCIGTKYCSNNCPYKVRRFNFFDYNKDKHLPVLTLLANPNVTVRQRGVMEKCNYCIQRVNRARMDAEKENRRVRDGEVVTACQQACPTEALVFGDLNDPSSRAAKMRKEPLEYPLLAELNTRPRTTYLAKLTNPNPEIRS
ncbi:MAG TPA: TAT-variant-translocated molybdopterin oxidoreductase [Thermoanaerobaculia bacterium]|jgi:molybdopterin-containing oxidoreductase family iron-sulfur binding subunit